MYIYNVTSKVDWSIHDNWVKWMKEVHIPEVMGKGCFTKYHFARLLETDDTEGPTYSVQYHAPSLASYEHYIAKHAPALRKDALDKWGNLFIGFRSLMELVN
jgi:hypothetical protein